MQRRPLVFALLALLPLWPLCGAAQTFKCKLADGRFSFQDRPCQGEASGGQITVKPTAPSADPAEIQRATAAAARSKAQAQQLQKAADDARGRDRQADEYNRSVRCNNARSNLGVLKQQRPVFRYDNNGDKHYVDDANRQAEIAAAERAVASSCL